MIKETRWSQSEINQLNKEVELHGKTQAFKNLASVFNRTEGSISQKYYSLIAKKPKHVREVVKKQVKPVGFDALMHKVLGNVDVTISKITITPTSLLLES